MSFDDGSAGGGTSIAPPLYPGRDGLNSLREVQTPLMVRETLRRYQGEPLPPQSRIAVVANDALGNFVIATPLLQMLRAAHCPSSLDFYGGIRTRELQEATDLADRTFCLHGVPVREALEQLEPTYDLVVNLENSTLAKTAAGLLPSETGFVVGPCVGPCGRDDLRPADDDRGRLQADHDWISADLPVRYPFVSTGWIAEIFCRLAYLEGPIPDYRLPWSEPKIDVPDILIATAGSGNDKLWSRKGWMEALEWVCRKGLSVGLLGAKPDAQRLYWKGESIEDDLVSLGLVRDLRGELALPEVVGALSKAKAVLTIDNGIMHLASGANVPTVALFRPGIHRLWAPPSPLLRALLPDAGHNVSEIEATRVIKELQDVV